jgi:ligand-binding sensor domain-containing protein/signal transduction histidine kinase/DNA-binding response OmpR family regulator
MIHKAINRNFIICWLFLLFPIYSLEQGFDFRNLTVENGLSQNSVAAIAQDKKGFLWLGTRYGLNRYDGSGFKIYKKNSNKANSLSDNIIYSLIVDNEGVLWAGTTNGLNSFNEKTQTFEKFFADPLNANSISDNSVNCLLQDSKNNIWIGTRTGLNRLVDKKKHIFESKFGVNKIRIDKYVKTIFESSDGYLWIGTSSGLIKMSINDKSYKCETFLHNDNNKNTLSENYITAIAEDAERNIWVGTLHNGINLYNKTNNSFTRFSQSSGNIIHNSIRKIMLDNKGKLWIGTQDGLSIFDPIQKKSISYQHNADVKTSITNNSIHAIFQDLQGSIWVGTYYGGVNIAYSFASPFTIYQNNIGHPGSNNNIVSSILDDANQNLWIGTEGGGLNYFNKANRVFNCYKNIPGDSSSLSSNLVKTIYKDRNNNLWVGTSYGGGLNLFDKKNKTFKHITIVKNSKESFDEVLALLEDSKDVFWVGSLSGLTILNKEKGQFSTATSFTPLEKQLNNKSIHILFEDSQKNLWIGTASGLHLLKNNSSKIIVYLQNEGNNKSLQSDDINCITEDSKHRIWIGTYYGGISMYNTATQTFTTYTDKDGLLNNNVLAIKEDNENNLWLSTDNGLSKFNENEKKFKNYTVSDGLASNKFNNNSAFKSNNGEIFFGSNNGLISFSPSAIETNKYTSPVVFTSLKLFDNIIEVGSDDNLLKEDINLTDKIVFNHEQNIFTIGFALLNYIKPEKNSYAYMLEGFEKRWNFTKNTSATYNNLPSGEYTFLVKAANNDGLWNERPAILKIKILPPIWKTWWAYCLYTIIITTIIVFFMRFLWIRELYKQEQELQKFKLNFFTNISHEISTHLTLISAPIEKMLASQSEDNLVRKQLMHVKKNADRLLNLVRELMDFRKAETNNLSLRVTNNNIIMFLQEIIESFKELAESKNITLSFKYPENLIPLYFDIKQMEKVIFNLLTNAFKFTHDNGHISVEVIDKKNEIIIKVIDDGKGIAPENLKKLFINFFQVTNEINHNTGYGIGLALAKSIIELHKGSITVQSELAKETENGHTIFTVILLKGKSQFSQEQLLLADLEKIVDNDTKTNNVNSILNEKENYDNSSQKPTVLLVEDQEEVRTFINESLSIHYNVLECKNGVEGLNTALENIPDLIISDIMMPEMDGLTLARKLRFDERTNHIPIILLTAKTSEDNQVEGLETGVDIYITKPFRLKMLELQVHNLIVTRKAMREKFSRQIFLEPTQTVISTLEEDFLQKVIVIIEDYLDDPEFNVVMLSHKVAMSQPVLYKKIKALTNMSVNDFIKSIRLKKAAQLLKQKKLTVYEVAYAVGYSDRKYFSQEFKKQFGDTPSEYIKKMQ